MLMIVIHHYAYHGEVDLVGAFNQQTIGLQLLTLGGNLGVLLFAMIGAYFLVGSKMKWQRIFHLFFETYLYSWLMLIAVLLFKRESLTIVEGLELLLPVPGVYWFVDYYFILILMAPAIFTIMSNWTPKVRKAVFLLSTLFLTVGPSFHLYYFEYPIQRLMVFIYIIYTMGWIRLDAPKIFDSKKIGAKLGVTGSLLFALSVLWYNGKQLLDGQAVEMTDFNNLAHIVLLMTAFGLFIVFKNLDIGAIKWINQLAGACFGVYLIHEQPMVRQFLWLNLFDNRQYDQLLPSMVMGIINGALVFIGCLIISYAVQFVFGGLINKISRYFGGKVDQYITRSMTK